jgi:restriction endonuclease Mrr
LIPKSTALRIALIEVLKEHSSEHLTKDIDKLSCKKFHLTDSDLSLIRSGIRNEFSYRMAWERTYAKTKGHVPKLENRHGAITDSGRSL